MAQPNGSDVHINEVVTDFVVTEGVGALSPEEVRTLVKMVLEHVRREQDIAAQRNKATAIHNHAVSPNEA